MIVFTCRRICRVGWPFIYLFIKLLIHLINVSVLSAFPITCTINCIPYTWYFFKPYFKDMENAVEYYSFNLP